MTEPVFSGLDNYKRLLTDSKFIKALKNTLELIVIIVPLQTVSGILVSSFLVANRKKVLGKLANCIVFIPVLCADAVAGVVWREFLNGKLPVVEHFFGLFGIDAPGRCQKGADRRGACGSLEVYGLLRGHLFFRPAIHIRYLL